MLFDLCCQVDVSAVVSEHGGMGDAKGALIGACGNVEQIDVWFKLLGNAYSLIQTVAFLHELRAGQAELNGEEGTHRLPDGLQHLNGKPAAVFQGAAVLVVPLVEHRGQKLVDEPAVAAVDH